MIKQTKHFIKLEKLYDGDLDTNLNQYGEADSSRINVLHIHGFSDYFFHDHVVKRLLEEGYNFFALDMRRNGRVRKPNQQIFFVKSIEEYFEEIEKALQIIMRFSGKGIVFLAHSLGGLTTSLFVDKFQKKYPIKALVLNSPFFNFFLPNSKKKFLKIFSVLATFLPYAKLPTPKTKVSANAQALHKKYFGEWDYNLEYKVAGGVPIYAAWVKAILEAQKKLKKGLQINIPVLILHSNQSIDTQEYKPEVHFADVVLDVEDIKKYGKNIGKNVDFLEVKNAVHDVFLSRKQERQLALDKTIAWLNNKIIRV